MKNLWISFAVSLTVLLTGMFINYRSYQETHYLSWSYRQHGGEITIEFAPGWHAVHIYAMRQDQENTHSLHFSPVSLAVCLLVLTAVGWGVLTKFSTGVVFKDFFLLLAGYGFLCFGVPAIMDLFD